MDKLLSGRKFFPLYRNGKIIYTSRVYSDKYIFVLGKGPLQICKFEDIDWKCIQTRTLRPDWVRENYPTLKMPEEGLNFKALDDVYFDNGTPKKNENGLIIGMEYSGLLFNILLLNDPKMPTCQYQYNKKMSLVKALLTFQCILTLL